MWQLLERLRQKPDIQKKSIALLVSGAVAGIVLFSWLASFSFSSNDSAAKIGAAVPELQTATPVQAIKEQIGLLKETIDAVKSIEE